LLDYPFVRFLMGDVRDEERLRRAVENIDFVFHAAALKHVPLCELNPLDAVKTNVLGTQNLIKVVIEEEVEKFIAISTDKAVNPVNVMGATKLLAERLTTSANIYKGLRKTAFSCVRFGNVLDSRGSVIRLFSEQIERGGPVIITDPKMTRFIMSISKAVDLVLRAMEIAHGGEVFIFKMPALRISDLAEVMIEELAPRYGYKSEDIKIEIIGKRAGEKIYEELLTEDEAMSTSEIDNMFVLIPEAMFVFSTEAKNQGNPKISIKEYRSDTNLLTKEEIKEMIREYLPKEKTEVAKS